MISSEYLPNEGEINWVNDSDCPSDTVPNPCTHLGISVLLPRMGGRMEIWENRQLVETSVLVLADSCKEGREKEQKCAKMVKTKGTIWLWGDLGSSIQHQDRHPHPAKPWWTESNIPALAWFDPTFLSIPEGSNHPTHKHGSQCWLCWQPKEQGDLQQGESNTGRKKRVWKVNSNIWMNGEPNMEWGTHRATRNLVRLSLTAKQSQGSSDIKPNPGVTAQHRVLLQKTLGYGSYWNYIVFLFFF